jgi:DNA (cytosine-5)-methyltransferase 1
MLRKPKLLDLFCGGGGASMGYHRAGFDVTGVDIAPQKHYPFKFVQADALDYVAQYGWMYEAIHASPPCQAHTTMKHINKAQWGETKTHLDLIPLTRFWLETLGLPYIIENVQGAPLKTQIIICGHSMGLLQLARHRHFESNILLFTYACSHRRSKETMIGVYGEPDGRRITERRYKLTRAAKSLDEGRKVMGIDWMDWNELKESIPPAYTEFLGRQLMRAVEFRRAVADAA